MKPVGFLRRVARETSKLHPWGTAKSIARGWREHEILTYAAAIAFQVFFALIPLLLFGLGMLGELNLEDWWDSDVAGDVRGQVSPPVFQILDDTVQQILDTHHLYWATGGAVLATYEVSAAISYVMDAMNRIYGTEEHRRSIHRYGLSVVLAVVASMLVLATVVVVRFGTAVLEDWGVPSVLSFIGRWTFAVIALSAVVALLVRYGPAKRRPWQWVSFGTLVTVGGWITMSSLFVWYLTSIAHYGSLFGNLATVFVILEYLYLSAAVGLTGVLVDALARGRVDGER